MMRLSKLSRRDRRVLTIGGGIVAAILVVVYGVLPFYESLSEVEGELAQKQRVLDQRIRAIGNQAVHQEELEWLDRELFRLRSQLLDARDPALAQNQLENIVRSLAEENGVVIARSTPLQERKAGDHYSKITVVVNLQCGMSELSNFLYALSVHPKFLSVEEFNVNTFRVRDQFRLQPRMNVSAFIALAEG
jgi:hypothetical protein